MNLHDLGIALLIGSVVVLVAIVAVRWADKLGLPGLLLYLILGLGLGEAFPSLNFSDASLATVLGYTALTIILAEGGLTTRMSDLRPVLWPAAVLATIGVTLSIAIVAVPLVYLAGLDWRTAILVGAVLAATDAAAVFSVLRRLRLHPRLRSLLEAEAGFNDAPVVVLVVVLTQGTFSADQAWQVPLIVIGELVGGVAVGVAVGFAARWALPRLALPAVGLYPIAVMAILVGAYGLATLVHSSGFLATYIAGVLIGAARDMPHRRAVSGFAQGLAWGAEIGLFVMLGLLADPGRAVSSIWPAVVAGVTLVVLARPISSYLSLAPFRMPLKWIAFTGVAGLRGAVPIVFATIALGAGIAGADTVFDTTLILVIVLTLVQTPLLPWAGRKLDVDVSGQSGELDVEAAPLDSIQASLLAVEVNEESRMVGMYTSDLRLPRGAAVSLVVREDRTSVPDRYTRLRPGDRLLIVCGESVRSATEKRLRDVAKGGRLAGWRRDAPNE
ncbi:MAG: potassium/proton antiporter [Actinobacteria bacterium]|nr:potassium/proton antiporter [Actinomycetota bacterium]